jgi:hypothetical protein
VHAILASFSEHLASSSPCHAQHTLAVRSFFDSFGSNPLAVELMAELLAPHDRAAAPYLTVAKIVRDGDSTAYYLEAADMATFSNHFGTTIGQRFTLEWIEMRPDQFAVLPRFQGPASSTSRVPAEHQSDGR